MFFFGVRLSRRLCAVDAERRAVVLRRWGRFTWTSSSKVAAGPSQWQWLSEPPGGDSGRGCVRTGLVLARMAGCRAPFTGLRLLLARHQSQGYREGIRHTSTLHRVARRFRRPQMPNAGPQSVASSSKNARTEPWALGEVSGLRWEWFQHHPLLPFGIES